MSARLSEVFTHNSFDDHEQVLFVSEKESGLRAIIGIHSTALGPAAGGCRMYPYASVDEALTDVLRLSRGMTMKNAVADLPLGGGKCVVIANPATTKKDELLRALGRHIDKLAGRYWTAIDVGVSSDDAEVLAEQCRYVFAKSSEFEGDDPAAHYTALGGFQGVRAMAYFLRGSTDMRDLRVAVQGVGQTGADLVEQLIAEGAKVIATDVNQRALSAIASKFDVRTVPPEEIYAQHVDVFAPCAMGGVLNDETIAQLNCSGVAGLANNQLERPENGRQLLERNIAYAPDFVVNAGGMMRAGMPIFGDVNPPKARQAIGGIFDTVVAILREASDQQVPSEEIAEKMATDRLKQATSLRGVTEN